MTESDDIDMLAAEYVLGTLDARERAAVASRRVREPRLDAAIADWEKRLAPLADAVLPIEPPPSLRARIERRLADDPAEPRATIAHLQKSLRIWRTVGVAGMAVAASLAVVVGLREAVRDPPARYVAVFHKDDETPSFLLTIDLDAREVTVRPVAAPRQSDRNYQLWIASAELGDRPRSLGLLQDGEITTAQINVPIDQGALRVATFGVSVEPLGGSPTGVPTGPALHAKLIRLAP